MSIEARPAPSLPASDPAPEVRRAALAAAQHAYVYDFGYADLCFVQKLPLPEHFGARYLVRAEEISLALAENRAASTVGAAMAGPAAPSGDALDPWHRMFPTLRAPRALGPWREDWCFGWQRLAGPCPVVLRRLDRLPPWLPIADADVARALGQEGAGVAGALDAGRLYVADYAAFTGLRAGVTDARQKYLWAPVALFVATAGGLAPVAIQIEGHAGTADTLVRPREGARWMLARAVVQAMDESHQGAISHVGICHMVVQRFILAARRRLAPWHPLLVLLAPHFENTLAVNQVARESVVSPGGSQDRLLAPVLDDQLALLRRHVAEVDLASLDPTVELARRGVDDPAALPVYPFRDDSLPIWRATRDFVAEYVALYYPGDADVAADVELAAFVAEVGARDGGRLPAMMAGARVEAVGDVVDLVARVVFRASTFHAAINDGSYDWVAFAPNMPSAPFAPFPPPGTGAAVGAGSADDALAAMLPTVALSWEVVSATYRVAEVGQNRLGRYDEGHFADARVAPLVARFQERLGAIEAETEARNRGRVLPYEYLLPSRITASINA